MTLGPQFRRLWIGNASSNLADGITFVSLPLLAATETTDPLAISGLAVAYTAPRILSVLGIGVLVDRADRRRLLYGANVVRAAIFAALTALVLLDAAPLAVLYAVYAAMGLAETVSDSAAFAVLPQAVPAQHLDRANSRIARTQVVVDEFVGPPLGGFLFALAAFAPSAVTVAAFLLAAGAYRRLAGEYRPARELRPGRGQAFAEIREGVVWAARHRVVRLLIGAGAVASVAYMIPFSYLVLYAEQVLGLDAHGYGLLLAFSAVGGVLGSLVAVPLRRWIGYRWSIVVALGVGAGSFAVVALSTHVVVVGVALAAYIAHAVVWNVLAVTVRQRATPAAMLGRVGAAGRLLSLIGLAVGAAAGGALASLLGYRAPFAVAAVLFAVVAVICAVTARGDDWASP